MIFFFLELKQEDSKEESSMQNVLLESILKIKEKIVLKRGKNVFLNEEKLASVYVHNQVVTINR